jgi:signal transduction histidine kinase
MQRIRNALLHPPLGDFDRVQKTVFLNLSLLITAAASAVIAFINVYLQASSIALALGLLCLFCLVGLFLVYRGRSRLVSLLFSFLIISIVFLNLYDGTALYDSGILALPILIIFLGYLYGRRVIPILTLLIIAFVAGLGIAESAGWIHPPLPVTVSRIIVVCVLILLTAILHGAISNNWEVLVARIRESNEVLKRTAEECGLAEREVQILNEQLEERVRDRTAKLETANYALRSFGYSLSHDLRGPIRRIRGYASILLEDHGEALGAEGVRQLKIIREYTDQMDALVNGILSLTRISEVDLRRETVDLSAMVSSIAAEWKREHPDRRVEFVIAEHLSAHADPALARTVLDNLLGNAGKFTAGKPEARIEFGSQNLKGETVFHIRDDGAGFDMRAAERLFVPFQRLHSEQEFPGIGIGLATIERILQRHGGRIWAEGEPGKGATFYFTFGRPTG